MTGIETGFLFGSFLYGILVGCEITAQEDEEEQQQEHEEQTKDD